MTMTDHQDHLVTVRALPFEAPHVARGPLLYGGWTHIEYHRAQMMRNPTIRAVLLIAVVLLAGLTFLAVIPAIASGADEVHEFYDVRRLGLK